MQVQKSPYFPKACSVRTLKLLIITWGYEIARKQHLVCVTEPNDYNFMKHLYYICTSHAILLPQDGLHIHEMYSNYQHSNIWK